MDLQVKRWQNCPCSSINGDLAHTLKINQNNPKSPDSDDVWTWGDEAAPNRVTGPALDFCLLVTQRRHRDDTALSSTGPVADEWLSIAQAFAGPAGPGRKPGQFR